jgi:seryl-tRNA synthetase
MATGYYFINLVRYALDSIKKEWNDIGKLIRDKKKANKEDPCE